MVKTPVIKQKLSNYVTWQCTVILLQMFSQLPTASVLKVISNVKIGNSIQLLTKATKKQKQTQYYAKTDIVRSPLPQMHNGMKPYG